jgi:hypothetical protein
MRTFPTLKNSFSPQKNSVNIYRIFFSINFTQIFTKKNRVVLTGFFTFKGDEKHTWRVGKEIVVLKDLWF